MAATDYFPTADDMQESKTLSIVIYNEIDAIQRAILAGNTNQTYMGIVNNTTMTMPTTPTTGAFTVNLTTNAIVIPNHGLAEGSLIQFQLANSTMPMGNYLPLPIQAGFVYYVHVLDANNIQIADSQNDLMLGNYLVITNSGQGTFSYNTIPLSQQYFQVWQGLLTNNTLNQQMTFVINYFTNLGYTITRYQYSSTVQAFYWSIQW